MDIYKPTENKSERLVLSNMGYALLKYFYGKGYVAADEAMYLDQRSFGPCVARGLIRKWGGGFQMTPAGRTFVERYETREPLKTVPSKQFSHYIQFLQATTKRSRSHRAA